MPIHPIPIWRLQLIPMGWSTAFANASPTCHLGGPGETLPMGWPPTAPWCGGTLPECWEMVAGNIKQLVLNMVFAQNCYGYFLGTKRLFHPGKKMRFDEISGQLCCKWPLFDADMSSCSHVWGPAAADRIITIQTKIQRGNRKKHGKKKHEKTITSILSN